MFYDSAILSSVGAEQRALRALDDHTALILRGIRSTIGNDLHLRRAGLVQQVIGQLESTQVVLLSGPAGSGKSAVAKDAIAVLSPDYFAFSFRAEEFAQPHFDATLQSSQIPVSAATLGAILASQDRKVLLIESVERLLEKSTRDAFSDLLTLAATDTSWRIVLTCRDYSADLVRACFLESARVGHAVIAVPHLNDGELAEVEAAYPALAGPLPMQGCAVFCGIRTFSTRLCRSHGQRSARYPKASANFGQSSGGRSFVQITVPLGGYHVCARKRSCRSPYGGRGRLPCTPFATT